MILGGTPRTARAKAALAAAGLLCLTATACSSQSAVDGSSVGSTDTGSDAGGEPYVQIDLDITGDITLKGAGRGGLVTSNGFDYDSCDTYGAGEDDGVGAKEMVYGQGLREPVNGKTILVGLKVENYHGAGTYERKDLSDVAGGAGIDLGGTLYTQEPGSRGTMTADGKGGGKWEFARLSTTELDGTTGKHTITGSVTFTCKNG